MPTNPNEITPKEFYEAIMKMEGRIIDRLDKHNDEITIVRVEVGKALTRMDDQEKKIDKLQKKSNIIDIILAFLTVIGSAIAVVLRELKLK